MVNHDRMTIIIKDGFGTKIVKEIAHLDLTYRFDHKDAPTKKVAHSQQKALLKKISRHKGIFKELSFHQVLHWPTVGSLIYLSFQGECPQHEINMADAIGRLWVENITAGMGSYSKLNADDLPQLAGMQAKGTLPAVDLEIAYFEQQLASVKGYKTHLENLIAQNQTQHVIDA